MSLLFWAGLILIVIPALIISTYALLISHKKRHLKDLFAIIRHPPASNSLRGKTADQPIRLLHQNKILAAAINPIVINIYDCQNDILAYYLLRAEIRFLIECLEKRRGQRLYLNTVTPEGRSTTLKILSEARHLLENVEIVSCNFLTKIEFVSSCYRALVKIYYLLPNANKYQELNFFPLFVIVAKNPTRELLILPYYPPSSIHPA